MRLWNAQLDAEQYKNPILPLDYSDPDAIRVGEDYYMVASSFTYLPGVPVLHSRDLVNWERLGYCVSSLPFARYAHPAHGCGTWAPAIRFHNGTFYVFIPLPDEGIFVTESKDPAGPWSPLRCIRRASGWIDPCPLWDDDGKVYMVHAFANSRCGIKHRLQMSTLDPETLAVTGDGPVIFDGRLSQPTAEGPKLYKRCGKYYIFIPAGGVGQGWQTVLRADNIYGPYEEKIVLHQGNTAVNGPHQGAWVDAPDGSDWFLHFQDADACGRVVHLQPMCWKGGWPFIGQEQNGDGIGEPVAQWRMPAGGRYDATIEASDDFTARTLSLPWQWQANPDSAWYECTGRGLKLFIEPARAEQSIWELPNVLSQMLPAADFNVEVKLALHAEQGGCCGIGILGQSYSLTELVRTVGGYMLSLRQGIVEGIGPCDAAQETKLASVPIQENEITLYAEITRGCRVQYFYKGRHIARTPLGNALPVTRGVWTGARFALYAHARAVQGTGFGCIGGVTFAPR